MIFGTFKAFFDIEDSVTVSEHNLNNIIDILKSDGDKKINYYYNIIKAIENNIPKDF